MDKDKPKTRMEQAADFEAKAKAIRRAEKAFWAEVEQRLPEVKKRFNLTEKVQTDFHKPEADHRPSFSG